MKVVIAGDREITDPDILNQALYSCRFLQHITEVVTGGAKGVDSLGDKWALINGIDRVIFHANWEGHGKSAGFLRNKRMIDYISINDGLIALPGNGPGTRHTIKLAEEKGIKYIHIYEGKL